MEKKKIITPQDTLNSVAYDALQIVAQRRFLLEKARQVKEVAKKFGYIFLCLLMLSFCA